MKKIIALVIAILMMTAIAVPAFAGSIEGGTGEGKPNETLVEYGVSEAYVVTIPAKVTFDSLTRTGSATVSASGVMIAGGTSLKVTVDSDNYRAAGDGVTASWVMKDTGASDDVDYMIKVDGGDVIGGETVVLEVESEVVFDPETDLPIGNSGSATLAFSTVGTSQVGTYQDILKFTATVS